MTNAITTTAVKDLLKETLGTVAYDYDNLIKNGTDGMKAYLKDANLPEKQKAELYSNFMGQVITTSIQASIMLAGDIAKANAEFDFRSNEKLKSVEELNILKEQLKQEQYKTLTIMPKEYEGLVQDVLMKQATIVTESKKQLQTIADTARLSAQKLLLDAETDGETKKNAVNGVIDRQTELYNQQALSFKGHNLSKGADSIAQIVGMIVAEGAVPDAGIINAHSKCVTDLAALSGTTITAYSTVK